MDILSFLRLRSAYNKCIEQNPDSIILFSEGNMYRNTHSPLLAFLTKHTHVIYLTLDCNDDLLTSSHANISPFLVDMGLLGGYFLENIKAKLFITTTPGLGSLALKKSKNIRHYSYFVHAPTDIHRYAKFSFDCFDSMICCGEYQVKSLNHLEKVRNFPIKEKVALGVPYYDVMVKEYDALTEESQENTVLIAPSWGNGNFLNYYKQDVIGQLLQHGYAVIFRPHPQSYKHEPHLINRIIKNHGSNPLFSLDRNISNISSMKKASLLISSYSGMIFDFIFLTEKPCILFDIAHIGSFFEDQDIDFPSWQSELMPHIGKLVSLNQTLNITEILQEIQDNQDSILSAIRQAKRDVSNFGNCSAKIVDFFCTKLKEL
ncbi:MAG: CDP-glycerol glycerophosphotransferase family protein [Brevinema sp.]